MTFKLEIFVDNKLVYIKIVVVNSLYGLYAKVYSIDHKRRFSVKNIKELK